MTWSEKRLKPYLKRNAHRFDPMRYYIRQHQKIADLGISKGGAYYQIKGKEIIGVDIDWIEMGRAKEINPEIKTIQRNVVDTGLPDKYFDLVVLSQIIEHLKDYKPLIKEAMRICRDDGYFLIGLPLNQPTPVHFHPVWTEEDVKNLCKKFGELLDLQKTKGGWEKHKYLTDSWLAYVKKSNQ